MKSFLNGANKTWMLGCAYIKKLWIVEDGFSDMVDPIETCDLDGNVLCFIIRIIHGLISRLRNFMDQPMGNCT